MSGLWLPTGSPLQKDTIDIDRHDLQVLADLHEFAQKHGLSLVCKKCDHAILGNNDGQARVVTVACKCREFRYDTGRTASGH